MAVAAQYITQATSQLGLTTGPLTKAESAAITKLATTLQTSATKLAAQAAAQQVKLAAAATKQAATNAAALLKAQNTENQITNLINAFVAHITLAVSISGTNGSAPITNPSRQQFINNQQTAFAAKIAKMGGSFTPIPLTQLSPILAADANAAGLYTPSNDGTETSQTVSDEVGTIAITAPTGPVVGTSGSTAGTTASVTSEPTAADAYGVTTAPTSGPTPVTQAPIYLPATDYETAPTAAPAPVAATGLAGLSNTDLLLIGGGILLLALVLKRK